MGMWVCGLYVCGGVCGVGVFGDVVVVVCFFSVRILEYRGIGGFGVARGKAVSLALCGRGFGEGGGGWEDGDVHPKEWSCSVL